jgi:AcrR family transcriptional regulator
VNTEYFIDYSLFGCYKFMMDALTENAEDNRELILKAAEERFSQYGFNKTTMAEIAKDCGMSAANLYRYFKNKQDIGAAFAQTCMAERADVLREVVRRPGLSATERLQEYILAMLRHNHQVCTNQPNINELVLHITSERQDIIRKKVETEQSLIAEILSEGNRTGEFDVPDVLITAEAINLATVKFGVPIFVGLYPLDEFERKAINVVDLLIQGLKKH